MEVAVVVPAALVEMTGACGPDGQREPASARRLAEARRAWPSVVLKGY